MMFNMFVNLFWKAEGFGYMWVPFELGYFNNLCLVFSHEKQKNLIYMNKSQNLTLWFLKNGFFGLI